MKKKMTIRTIKNSERCKLTMKQINKICNEIEERAYEDEYSPWGLLIKFGRI